MLVAGGALVSAQSPAAERTAQAVRRERHPRVSKAGSTILTARTLSSSGTTAATPKQSSTFRSVRTIISSRDRRHGSADAFPDPPALRHVHRRRCRRNSPKTQKISWTLTVNGMTTTIPFYMHTDYNISPFKSSEESAERRLQQAAARSGSTRADRRSRARRSPCAKAIVAHRDGRHADAAHAAGATTTRCTAPAGTGR